MTSRRLPIPITFLVVVVATVFLVIFFGAWAASADGSDRGRTLTFGFANSGTNLDTTSLNSSQLASDGTANLEDGTNEDGGDSWWQKAFIKACPLH